MTRKTLLSLFLAFLLTLNLVPVIGADAPDFAIAGDVIILHSNDTHGYVKADDAAKAIGLDTYAAIKDSLDGKALLLDAGDATNGQPFAAKTKGMSPIETMNAAGYDAMTIGNHEFDYADNIEPLMNAAKFPFLSANIHKKSDGSLLAKDTVAFTINGAKIGVFGLTTPDTAFQTFPDSVAPYDFGTPESITKNAVDAADKLVAEKCDIVIGLFHMGIEGDFNSLTLAPALSGKVDVIIDGHSHASPDKNVKIQDVWVVSTGGENNGGNGTNLGALGFVKNASGDYDMAEPTHIDFQTARDNFKPKESVTTLINTLNAPVDAMETNVLATIQNDLNGERADVRTKETNLGNASAEACRAFTGSDVAMLNAGGIRSSIKAGDVTEKNLFTTFPYGNVVYKSSVTGRVIREALELSLKMYPDPNAAFMQIAGIRYIFDPSKPEGERIVFATIGDKAINDDSTYSLATNDYIASGGDGYAMLKQPFKTLLPYTKPATSDGSTILMDVFVWYLKEYKNELPSIDGRIQTVSEECITRSEFAAVVNKTLGYTETDGSNFADCSSNDMAIAKKAGYITGDGDNNARPDDMLTGPEMAVIMTRLLNLTPVSAGSYNVPDWAAPYVSALESENIPSGILTAESISNNLAELIITTAK